MQSWLHYAADMELPTHEELLANIEAFRERHGLSKSRFGVEAAGEQQLILSLERGGNPTLKRLHRIADYMRCKDAELRHGTLDIATTDAASSGTIERISERSAA